MYEGVVQKTEHGNGSNGHISGSLRFSKGFVRGLLAVLSAVGMGGAGLAGYAIKSQEQPHPQGITQYDKEQDRVIRELVKASGEIDGRLAGIEQMLRLALAKP